MFHHCSWPTWPPPVLQSPMGHPVLTTQTLLGPEKLQSAERFPCDFPRYCTSESSKTSVIPFNDPISIWFLFLLKQRLSQSQQRNSHVASQHHTDIEVKQLTEEKYWITKHIQNYCWYWNIAHQHFWCLQKDILLVYLCFFFQDVKEIRCLSPLSTIISKLPTFRWGLLHPIELPLNAHQFKYPGSYPIQIPTISH